MRRPTELGPDTLPGSPPKWYTSQLLDTVLEAYQNGSKFHVHESADMIRCTPEASVLQQRDTLVSQLQTGSIPYLDLEGLLREFPELYPSREQLEERLGTLPDVFIQGRTAVSDTWVTRFGDACVDAIKELGTYADLTVSAVATLDIWS